METCPVGFSLMRWESSRALLYKVHIDSDCALCGCISPGKGNKRKNEQIGLHQTNTFLHSKGNYRQNKRHPTEWENIFSDTSDKGLISKLYKVFTKLNIKKQTTNLKNGEGGKGL